MNKEYFFILDNKARLLFYNLPKEVNPNQVAYSTHDFKRRSRNMVVAIVKSSSRLDNGYILWYKDINNSLCYK